MKNNQTGALFMSAIKSFIKSSFRILIITLAWALKFTSIVLLKCGETIENITLKSAR